MDDIILTALAEKKMLHFKYDGKPRICEPHVFGIANHKKQILCYQIGGASSRPLHQHWRRFDLGGITNLESVADTFPGPRPIPSGPHSIWTSIIATV